MGIGSGWDDQSGIDAPDLKILVVGCGGGGCNSITRLNKIGLESAMTIAINTDQRSLKETLCENRVLIGANYTHGLGAGGLPEVGEQCARNCANLFCEMFNDVDLTFIITGLGGGHRDRRRAGHCGVCPEGRLHCHFHRHHAVQHRIRHAAAQCHGRAKEAQRIFQHRSLYWTITG